MATFPTYSDLSLTLRNKAKLKNTNIYLNEYLSRPALEISKSKRKDLMELKKRERATFLQHINKSLC